MSDTQSTGFAHLPPAIAARVDVRGPDECWPWTGYRDRLGYGKVGKKYGHRLVYEALVGPIPVDRELDHLCRNAWCVNPSHLEAVTHRVNVKRGASPLARLAEATHCRHGHPLSGDNLYMRKDTRQGRRDCKACRARRLREFRARRTA